MTIEFNERGGIEVHPGPRGFSVNGVHLSDDGASAHFTTDEPRTLNGVRLPRGPKGDRGSNGDPGEARIRVDETVGYRVYLWDTYTAGEQLVYGDTGVRDLGDGRLVRRTGDNVVELEGSIEDLPAGFSPAMAQPGTVHKTYTTAEEWPTALPGTEVVPPVRLRGLEGYHAAAAQGFPGTAEDWLAFVYGVLPSGGQAGQWLSFGSAGPAWASLPTYTPSPWTNITLESTWTPGVEGGNVARVRMNNGTIEFSGSITYVGPYVEAGVWGDEFVRIGAMPAPFTPPYGLGFPVTAFQGKDGTAGTPVPARVDVSPAGVLHLGAYELSGEKFLRVKANITKINLGVISFPARD